MYKNKNLYNTLFIVNYISSTLFLIFTLYIRMSFPNVWKVVRTIGDNGELTIDYKVIIYYLCVLMTVILISLTVYSYRKLKRLNKDS